MYFFKSGLPMARLTPSLPSTFTTSFDMRMLPLFLIMRYPSSYLEGVYSTVNFIIFPDLITVATLSPRLAMVSLHF